MPSELNAYIKWLVIVMLSKTTKYVYYYTYNSSCNKRGFIQKKIFRRFTHAYHIEVEKLIIHYVCKILGNVEKHTIQVNFQRKLLISRIRVHNPAHNILFLARKSAEYSTIRINNYHRHHAI